MRLNKNGDKGGSRRLTYEPEKELQKGTDETLKTRQNHNPKALNAVQKAEKTVKVAELKRHRADGRLF
jgi:hypothetical protein